MKKEDVISVLKKDEADGNGEIVSIGNEETVYFDN